PHVPWLAGVDGAQQIPLDLAVDLDHERRFGLGVGVVAAEHVGEALGVAPLPIDRIAQVPRAEADVAHAGPVGSFIRSYHDVGMSGARGAHGAGLTVELMRPSGDRVPAVRSTTES